MPTYEYACPTCGIVEVFQSIKEDALKKCPKCKKAKVQRMMSLNAGIIFKGSGFWETDYNRSADYQKKSKEEADGGTPSTQPKSASQPKKSDAPASASPSSAPKAPPTTGPSSPPSSTPPPPPTKP